jgi:hypothetical protein
MTEDRIRKGQGTTKPKPAAPKKGKRKYHLTLIFKDFEERPLTGTWVLNFGSLVEETFETTGHEVKFEIELDTSRDNVFYIRGNPYLTGMSFPPDAEYYYHVFQFTPDVGTNPNLTFYIGQKRHKTQFTESSTLSDSEVKLHAVATEFGSSVESSGETGLLASIFAKVAIKATITGKRVWTDSESTGTGSSDTHTMMYTVSVVQRRLAVRQKGEAAVNLDVDD